MMDIGCITKISRLGEIPTVDPVSGDFRPQDDSLSFEKVAKKEVKKNNCVSNLEVAPVQTTCDNLQT